MGSRQVMLKNFLSLQVPLLPVPCCDNPKSRNSQVVKIHVIREYMLLS
jgi:hypothetical protein